MVYNHNDEPNGSQRNIKHANHPYYQGRTEAQERRNEKIFSWSVKIAFFTIVGIPVIVGLVKLVQAAADYLTVIIAR